MNGIIKTLITLAGLIIGIILAGRFYTLLGAQLTFISQIAIANIVAFVIILMVVLVIAGIISFILSHAVKAILLGWLDHLLGGIFGAIMGIITVSALLAVWVRWFGSSDFITGSSFAVALLSYFPFILSLLPSDFGSIRNFFNGTTPSY
jgi:membrane protein required for colicin V production